MSLRDIKLTPLGVITDAEALTNERLEEEIKKLKEEGTKVPIKVGKKKIKKDE